MKVTIKKKIEEDVEVKEGIYALRNANGLYVYYCLRNNSIWRIIIEESSKHMFASLYTDKEHGFDLQDLPLEDIIKRPIENETLENSAGAIIALREALEECKSTFA